MPALLASSSQYEMVDPDKSQPSSPTTPSDIELACLALYINKQTVATFDLTNTASIRQHLSRYFEFPLTSQQYQSLSIDERYKMALLWYNVETKPGNTMSHEAIGNILGVYANILVSKSVDCGPNLNIFVRVLNTMQSADFLSQNAQGYCYSTLNAEIPDLPNKISIYSRNNAKDLCDALDGNLPFGIGSYEEGFA